jgi:large-conductance mechanosensitive channel
MKPVFETNVDSLNNLNTDTTNDFSSFISQNGILNLAIATTIGLYINKFTTGIMDVVGAPIVNTLLNGKVMDKTFSYTIYGMKLEIGKLIELILNLLITLIIIYLIFKLLPKAFRNMAASKVTTLTF